MEPIPIPITTLLRLEAFSHPTRHHPPRKNRKIGKRGGVGNFKQDNKNKSLDPKLDSVVLL